MSDFTPQAGNVYCMDIFDLCAAMPDASVDCILCDLPYGVSQSAWDSVIPFEPMWAAFKRIIKPRGAIVLTASQPFTSALVMSNPKMFRYEWIWNKVSPTGHLNVKIRPMMQHESILVFSNGGETYNPQYRDDATTPFGEPGVSKSPVYGAAGTDINYCVGYPLSIIEYVRPNNLTGGGWHSNQKPVALFEYLIRTYTQPGELVFDPCVGSGTTALAARLSGRAFIVGDQSADYCEIARQRVASVYGVREVMTQLALESEARP